MIQILHDVFLGVLYAFGIGFVGFLALCLFGKSRSTSGSTAMIEAAVITVCLTFVSVILICIYEAWK